MTNAKQTLNSEQFVTRLAEFGIAIKAEKLRRWSKQELIPAYKTRYKHRRKKNGMILEKARLGAVSEWRDGPRAVEETVAVWTLLRMKGVTAKTVKVVREWMSTTGMGGLATFIIPPVTRSRKGMREIKYTDITVSLAPSSFTMPDGSDGVEALPRKSSVERVALFDELIKKWIVTVAKVRYTTKQAQAARDTGKSSYDKWPLDRGAIVKVVNRRLANGRVSLWQLESLEIVPGQADVVYIFEHAGDEEPVDVRQILADNIRFERSS